jgi:spermidine synthase
VEYVEVARATSERGEVVLRERHDPMVRSEPLGLLAGQVTSPGTSAGAHPGTVPETSPEAWHEAPYDPGHGPRVLELRVNGVFVMDTLETQTERELALAALARVDAPRAVVVGGLGLGYTLHEVLADHRVERVVVVEVEDALVRWMRDGTIPHGPALLADERLHVVTADIRVAVNEAGASTYDLVLLDVDNGPGYLVYEDNAELYGAGFLERVAALLRPGGAVVIWSADEAPALAEALAATFGSVEAIAHDVRLRQYGGQIRTEQYWLYLARH